MSYPLRYRTYGEHAEMQVRQAGGVLNQKLEVLTRALDLPQFERHLYCLQEGTYATMVHMHPLVSLGPDQILQGLFFFLLLIFTIYGVVLGYHWFTFGNSRHTSMIALSVYLIGGAILFLILSGSMQLV